MTTTTDSPHDSAVADPFADDDGRSGEKARQEKPGRPKAASRRAAPRRAKAGAGRGDIRAAAEKALSLASQDERALRVLAQLLGVDADPVDLTVAVLASDRPVAGRVELIESLRADGELEAAYTVMEMSKQDRSSLWSLLYSIGAVTSTNPPAGDVKVARALTSAVFSMDDGLLDELRSAAALAA